MTLGDVLALRAARNTEDPAFRFLGMDGREVRALSYGELYRQASAIAAHLCAHHVAPGDRVMLSCLMPEDFVPAFMGITLCGAVPVPVPAARGRRRTRLTAVAGDCDPAAIVADEDPGSIDGRLSARCAHVKLRDVAGNVEFSRRDAGPQQPAFLQYTSGSTGSPKGVVVTHAAWLANAGMIARAFRHDAQSRFANWLPLFHDMGLVGCVLQPLYLGAESVLLPTAAFVEKPLRWIRMVSAYRAHTSGAPDSAYLLCAREAASLAADEVDLRPWRVAFNGAEPVRARTLQAFAQAFEPHGFQPSALLPCYGLAEATLLCSGRSSDAPPVVSAFAQAALLAGQVRAAGPGDADARALVCLGPPVCDLLLVRADANQACEPGEVGEICIAGLNVMERYWQAQAGGDGHLAIGDGRRFLRTGDLGFLHEEGLYVVGRLKDLIVVAGRNHHPQDLEQTACESHLLFAEGRGVALSLDGEEFAASLLGSGGGRQDDTHVVIVVEVHRHTAPEQAHEAMSALRRSMADEHDIAPSAIVLVRHGSIEVTTSGKVRRGATRGHLLSGSLALVNRWVMPQPGQAPLDAERALHAACSTRAGLEPITRALGQLCEQLLETSSSVRPGSRLAAVGITSLLALRLIASIRNASGVDVPLWSLYGTETVADVARFVHDALARGQADGAASAGRPEVGERPAGGDVDAGVQAVWFRRQGMGDRPFLLPLVIRCDAAAEPRLLAAIRRLPRRHPALATRFTEGAGGALVCRVDPELELAQEAESVVAEADDLPGLLAKKVPERIDLSSGPLRLVRATASDGSRVLLLLIHHIAADFWSVGLVLQELLLAARDGDASTVPALLPGPTSPAPGVEDEAYWTEQLRDCAWHRFPVDFVQAARPPAPAVDAPVEVPMAGVSGLAMELCQSPFAVILAGYFVTLWSYAPDGDLVVAVPVSLRGSPASLGVVGYLVRPLPIRVRLDPLSTHAEVIRRVGAALAAAMSHRGMTLAQIFSALRRSGAAIGQVALDAAANHLPPMPGLPPDVLRAGMRTDTRSVDLGPFAVSTLPPPAGGTEQAVELVSARAGDTLHAWVRVDGSILSASSAGVFASRMSACLKEMVQTPDRAVGAQNRWGLEERDRVLAWGVPSEMRPAPATTLQALVGQWARVAPDAIALVHGRDVRTYGQLWRAALAQGTGYRQAAGGRELKRVGLLLRDPMARVTGMLAAAATGAAVVAFNPDAPGHYLQRLLEASAVDLLVTDLVDDAPVPPGGVVVHRVGREDGDLGSAASAAPATATSGGAWTPAYVVFTSGSTGQPKGIEQTHAAFVRFLQWQAQALRIGPGARIGQIAAAGFDVSCCEVFGALCFGATLCLPDRRVDLAPDRFVAWLQRDSVTCIQAIPSFIGEVIKAGAAAWPPDLQVIANVGEPLRPAIAAEVIARGEGRIALVNIYGPSEVVAATFHAVAADDLRRPRIPVGRPIDGRHVRVLGAEGEVLPVGVEGEIWIESLEMPDGYVFGGEGVASGFVQAPDRVAGRPGRYRTGDLGAWTSDGLLDVRGRRDGQVKVRGVRIELGEVESVLMAHPQVARCLVTVSQDQGADVVLIALVVLHSGLPAEELIRHCSARLPHTHVPGEVHAVDDLPRLPNGKLDRSKVARRGVTAEAFCHTRVPTSTETVLIALWATYFPGQPLDPLSNFLRLGGNSITSIQLLNAVAQQLGVQVSIGEFLTEPTVESLARHVDASRAASAGLSASEHAR